MDQMMDVETLAKVEALDGKVRLVLASGGKSSYQYVYRAGSGVYWEKEKGAFTFDAGDEMTMTEAICHVISVLRGEMNLNVRFGDDVAWVNVPMEVRNAVRRIPI